MVRVLITAYPLMYREAIAFLVRGARPEMEIVLAAPEETREQIERLWPRLLVHTDDDGIPREVLDEVPYKVTVLYDDSMNLRIGVYGLWREVSDAGVEALLEIVDEAARPSSFDEPRWQDPPRSMRPPR
jgi:hypothetical protein